MLDAAELEHVSHGGRALMVEFCGLRLAPSRWSTRRGPSTRSRPGGRSATRCCERFPFAAFVSKTVTLAPREGNPPPRLWEQAGGMINSIGLPNKGLEGYLAHDLPRLAELPVPLIVNVMGFRREEVAELVAAFGERPEVAALELNVSCPNVKTGLVMGADPGETAALMDAVRPHTAKPLIVKLTPNCAAPGEVAAAAEAHGADAVSLINTVRALAHDPARPGAAWLGGGGGGLSGPAVRAVALAQLGEVAARVGVPIVGMGGVQTGRHAAELLAAGATLVAVGTESFRDPLAGSRVAAELDDFRANSGAGCAALIGGNPGQLDARHPKVPANGGNTVKQPPYSSTSGRGRAELRGSP